MPSPPPIPQDHQRLRASPGGPIAFGAILLASFLLLGSYGHEIAAARAAAILNAFVMILNAGLLGAAYLVAGIGLGRPVAGVLRAIPGVRESESHLGPVWLQAALGVGAILWLSHLIGMLGLLSGPAGLWIGWGVVGVGIVLAAEHVVRGPLRPERWRPLPLAASLAAPALGVILLAACSPPGALWLGASREGGGYDVLSYHLQLPKEWVAPGERLWPVQHNVYSFLPGYLEAAYLHLGAMTRGGLDHGGSFVAGSGLGVIACQMLHAFLGCLTALLVARVVRASAGSHAWPPQASLFPAVIAGATLLGVPWVMVVGSLAYNELGVTAMFAGALLVAMERAWSPGARGVAVGFLVGIACSIKPTSLFLVAPVAGLFLLFASPASKADRAAAALGGCAAGVLAMAPWLVRNFLASGNPVFPFASGAFGLAHWSREQMDRYSRAHAFDGSLADRFSLLFDNIRGIFNEQWAIFFPLGVIALASLVVMPRTRRVGVLLLLGFCSQVCAWLFLTHLQSRFLLPTLVPLSLALGLAANELLRWIGAQTSGQASARAGRILSRLAVMVVALVPLSLSAWSWLIYASQRAGRPNQLLAVGGVEFFTGQAVASEIAQLQPAQRRDALNDLHPAAFINFTLPPDRAVYFIGGATPLYFIPPGGPRSIVYHTTWDRNPLGEAIRAHPDDPGAWTAAIRAAPKHDHLHPARIDFVLVDFDELARLHPADGRRPVWFDPAVTPERLTRWLTQECEPVQAWRVGESGGAALFRLRDAAAPEP